ncbi:hypothetical protein DAPPUDRAFT_242099 [Daphnia pulex]|uniref:Uncharacterized protein n=1 Tax=Daphnia pulex TaxID=6669 RepID=E9GFV2_DAPPU|nr:hypothetical protein DAPPUDRAFT_242099 [Daphnia pulex]|eukprot:EFX81703.1 hypothetical protein DAPPUDRAFT_242099 [Daphnia pulex]
MLRSLKDSPNFFPETYSRGVASRWFVIPQHLDVSTFSETQLLLVDYSPINDSSFIIGILEAVGTRDVLPSRALERLME